MDFIESEFIPEEQMLDNYEKNQVPTRNGNVLRKWKKKSKLNTMNILFLKKWKKTNLKCKQKGNRNLGVAKIMTIWNLNWSK